MLKVSRKDFVMETLPDEYPDTSFYGEYTDKRKDNYVIDRSDGRLLGEHVFEKRSFPVVKEGGDYNLFHDVDLRAIKSDIEWLEESREYKDGYGFDVEFDNNNNPTVVSVTWIHPEVLAKGLSLMDRREYRYFESCNHSNPGLAVNWFPHVTKQKLNSSFKKTDFAKHGITPNLDKHPKEFWLDIFYFCEDYERMEDGNRGGWCMNGIRAKVTLKIPHGNSTILQEICSPGLWGIESDSDDEYIQEIYSDECETLAGMLKEMGIKVTK